MSLLLDKMIAAGRRFAVPFNSASMKPADNAVEAVFTGGNDIVNGITLSRIKIEAQAAQYDLATGQPYTKIGQNVCNGCESLGIQPIPIIRLNFW